ncbi:hypothetical protein, partial [Daeguia caeni]
MFLSDSSTSGGKYSVGSPKYDTVPCWVSVSLDEMNSEKCGIFGLLYCFAQMSKSPTQNSIFAIRLVIRLIEEMTIQAC